MTKEGYTVNRIKRHLFYILMVVSLGSVCVLQFFGPTEHNNSKTEDALLYQGEFVWEKTDGSREMIEVPGKYEVPAKTTMTIITQLPENYTESMLAIRSSLQSVRFYVDGELRAEYDTSEERVVGKNSASCYVFCPTSAEDAGKEVRIELQTNTNKYSGVVNAVYCGNAVEIWGYLFRTYGLETIIAFFLLFAGIVTIIFGFSLGIAYQTKFDMEYLGWCVFVAAVWMLGESKMRQLFVPNPSALSTLCFVMIMLSPIAIGYYMDTLLKGRYRKIFGVVENIAFLNLLICSVLHILGIVDYIESLPVAHMILVGTVLIVFITMICDLKRGYVSEKYTFLSIILAMAAAVTESLLVYFRVSTSGIFIGTGMLILLCTNLLKTIRNIQKMESQRQRAEMNKRRKQMETMSLQMMQTLSTTIEAKDEYTRGHSHRVAEYAALIAEELGWDKKEIKNLKNAAHLHDIGKICIPDNILNKPTRLTEEEFQVIKEHTVIGAEILKNITLISHVKEVARSHHERYDGMGYPDGLKGEEIPLYARVITVADSYDAMKSRRIYRNPLDDQIIYNEIARNCGSQFDPQIAGVFLKMLNENRVVIREECALVNKEDNLSKMEIEIEKFISDVMITMKAQEDSEGLDFLTGLPMRNRGEKLAAQFIQQDNGYLVFLDMDNLKKMNDLYGHKAGDRALKLLGSLLMEYAQHSVVCRLGGDEFLMFVPGVSKDEIVKIVTGIQEKFEQNKEKDAEIRCASVSVGICEVIKGDPFEECYSKADKALYHVKQNGKGSYFFYQQMENEQVADPGTGKDLALIAKALRDSGNYSGALNLEYREFAKLYEYMKHLGDRYRYQCYLVMVTLETTSNSVMHIENIEQALERMEQAIRKKIRSVDACTRYSSMQYLVILFEADESKISDIMERIFAQYDELTGRDSLIPKYEYIPMVEKNSKEE
ncbi:HD domain-containing phosphohydrolase [Blautia obeum]|uniref:HD domain-containing phosphohydrolase n=1 Tax=Blautia obeum TaxID=40520 RepID=UPI001FACFAE2|nr:HD domain-containing phosphohydrolase [Blautia obeum]